MQGDSELSALLWGQHSSGASLIRQTIKIAKTVRTCYESPVGWLGQSLATATSMHTTYVVNQSVVPTGRTTQAGLAW
jgi:hypothetical protein